MPDTPLAEAEISSSSCSDNEIRIELVERVRKEIAKGTYETPEKWEIALDRLLDRLEHGPA
jgi:hypothetical protein